MSDLLNGLPLNADSCHLIRLFPSSVIDPSPGCTYSLLPLDFPIDSTRQPMITA